MRYIAECLSTLRLRAARVQRLSAIASGVPKLGDVYRRADQRVA